MPTRESADARHAWSNALELGSRGRYGEAHALLRPLLDSDNPLHYAMGAAVRAHHLRELGSFDEALDLDNDALVFWEDAEIPVAWPYLDLKLARSYDALLAGNPAEAGEWLADALALEEVGDHRTSIRLVWCAAELALALDRAPEAIELLSGLTPRLEAAGQPRLDVATALLHGTALVAGGDRRTATKVLDEVLRIGAEGMWHSLMWRAAVLRAEVAETATERKAFNSAARILIQLICEDLDDAERTHFLESVPEAARP